MFMTEYGETVGEHTKDFDFDKSLKRNLANKNLNHELHHQSSLTWTQRLARLGAAAAVATAGIIAYKNGLFNSAESEQKGLLGQENHQTVDQPSEQNK